MKSRFQPIVSALAVAAFGLVMLPLATSALTPPPPAPWVIETVVIESASLPDAVTIETDSYGRESLANAGDEPFYLIESIPESRRGRPVDGPQWYPDGLSPEEYEPEYMLVSGRLYQWSWGRSIPTKEDLAISPWKQSPYSDSLALEYVRIVAEEPRLWDLELKEGEVPPSNPFTIDAYYRGEVVKIRGTITYTPNERYVPRAEQPRSLDDFAVSRMSPAGIAGVTWKQIIMVGLGIVGVTTILLGLRALRKRKAKAATGNGG